MALKLTNTMSQFTQAQRISDNKLEKSGVYEIICHTRKQAYIERTKT